MSDGSTKKIRRKYSHLGNSNPIRNSYMETPYVNGVVGIDGTQAIRPLNQEEKEFLDNFYKQYYHSNTKTTPEVTKLKKEITKLMKIISNNKTRLKKLKKKKNKVNKEAIKFKIAEDTLNLKKKKRQVSEIYKQQGNQITDYDDVKELTHDNYARNNCVFNIKNAKNELHEYMEDFFDDLSYENSKHEDD